MKWSIAMPRSSNWYNSYTLKPESYRQAVTQQVFARPVKGLSLMELEEIEVLIEADGQVTLHVRGIKGSACLDLTRTVEQALGGEVLVRQHTPEMLETPAKEHVSQQQLQQHI